MVSRVRTTKTGWTVLLNTHYVLALNYKSYSDDLSKSLSLIGINTSPEQHVFNVFLASLLHEWLNIQIQIFFVVFISRGPLHRSVGSIGVSRLDEVCPVASHVKGSPGVIRT